MKDCWKMGYEITYGSLSFCSAMLLDKATLVSTLL